MIEEFLKENTWSKLHVEGEAPCVRTGHCVSAFGNDSMYVFGGYSETGVLNDMHRLDIMMKVRKIIWFSCKVVKYANDDCFVAEQKWNKVEYNNNYITEIPSGK